MLTAAFVSRRWNGPDGPGKTFTFAMMMLGLVLGVLLDRGNKA